MREHALSDVVDVAFEVDFDFDFDFNSDLVLMLVASHLLSIFVFLVISYLHRLELQSSSFSRPIAARYCVMHCATALTAMLFLPSNKGRTLDI